MKVARRFTRRGRSPYGDLTFEPRVSEIRNPDGRVIFRQENVVVPAGWSQIATDILAQKYFRKTGVPLDNGGTGGEHDARQVFHRLAYTWMDWGRRYRYFDTEEDAQAFYDEICYMLAHQMAAPNSPQWFNTGLFAVYGIRGPAQGHFYADPETGEVRKSDNAYERPQPHACQPYRATVSTPAGPVPIGAIVERRLVGLEVHDGTEDGRGTTRVVAVAENGTKPVFRVVLKNGAALEATGDHLVRAAAESGAEERWVRVDELGPGMRLRLSTATAVRDGEPAGSSAADEAALAGWLHGDGFVGRYAPDSNRSLAVEFVTVDDDEFHYVRERVERVLAGAHCRVRTVESEDPNLDIRRILLYGESLRGFVEKYNLLEDPMERAVPEAVLQGGRAVQAAYLRSLFQADGTVRLRSRATRSPEVALTTTSAGLASGVQTLLLNLGIYARVQRSADGRTRRRTAYQLSIGYAEACRRFREQIGFVSEAKQEKLAHLCCEALPGKKLPPLREEAVLRIEHLGPMEVYDIQTESGQYLSNNIVVHNCFILSIEDDLVNEGGILDLVTREARLFKYGSGTGSNFSRLRGRGEPLSGGGVSSGLLSFLKVSDRSASAIKSGGTTRRAAKMVTLDADHPDIEEYVRWKVLEEQKVAAMVAGSRLLRQAAGRLLAACREPAPQDGGGASPAAAPPAPPPAVERTDPLRNPGLGRAVREAVEMGVPLPFIYKVLQLARQGVTEIDLPELTNEWDEEAYHTVSGQSSNNSVRLSAEFMKAVLEDGDWPLTGRIDGRANRTIKARRLWDLIAYAAWSCADPGVQFHSTINEWHTCPADGEIRASNPCSEYMFLDDTACNLASLNLMKFYDAGRRRFRLEELRYAIHLWTIVLEISVLMAQFPGRRIAQRSYEYRTLGLGFANLGSLLMVMGLPYDSEAGRAVAGALSAILTGQAYASSALLARELGPFARFEANRESMLRVIRNHRRAAYNSPPEEYESLSVLPRGLSPEHCPPELLAEARRVWDEALKLGEAHGYRNAQVSAIAPTGTIGLLMDCDTTGVEPDYALVKFKKLAGGGFFKIINSSIPPALRALGYSEEEIRRISAWCVGHRTLRGAPHLSREELARKGFPEEALDRLEAAVRDAFLLAPLFSADFLGRELLTGALRVPPEELARPGFDLLGWLGYSRQQVEEAERYACGAMSLEGAPGLKEEHYPIFDTASPTGRHGRRFIPWQAHIEMMAAVQPFISGAVSKTINMPAAATIEEVKGAHLLSWRKMLKAIALYRDGSKLSQPLSVVAAGPETAGAEEGLARSILSVAAGPEAGGRPAAGGGRPLSPAEPAGGEGAGGTPDSRDGRGRAGAAGRGGGAEPGAPLSPTRRRRLPNRRRGYTQKVKIGEHSLFLRTGEYPDGTLGEIFLDMYREGAAFRSLLNSFAIAVSLGLQYGVPLEEYVDAFIFSRFEPNGIVHGHDHLKVTTSVLDLIFRDLALNYLHRADLVQVKPDDLIATGTRSSGEPGSEGSQGRVEFERPDDQPELPLLQGGPAGEDAAAGGPAGRSGPAGEGGRDEDVGRGREGEGAGDAGTGAADNGVAADARGREAQALKPAARASAAARLQGYEGDPCPVCGHLTLVRNGTCLKCITCGSTTGCS